MILQGSLLAAEPNTAHDLMILQGGLSTAEPNTSHDLFFNKSNIIKDLDTERWSIGSGAKHSS